MRSERRYDGYKWEYVCKNNTWYISKVDLCADHVSAGGLRKIIAGIEDTCMILVHKRK